MAHYTYATYRSHGLLGRLVRIGVHAIASVAMVAVMLLFLAWLRWRENHRIPPTTIRTVEHLAPISLPPPAPPPLQNKPMEPKTPELPQLEIQLKSVAPSIKARLRLPIKPTLQMTQFKLQPQIQNIRPAQSSFRVEDLDALPMLINHPSVPYPASLARRGILQGTAVLKVSIAPNGRVTILSVISCNHSEIERMARTFAARARFSPPTKNGQAVTAIYHWPLNLKR